MTKLLALLTTLLTSSAIMAGTTLAEPLLPAGSAAPVTPPLPTTAPIGGLRPSPTTPHPLESNPIIPDPVRFGGFRPQVKAPESFLPEGTFIYQRAAVFSIDAEGKAILRFDPGPKDAKPPPPVYVLPNLKRMAIEDAIKGRALPLIVSGTITDFEGHNYLLLDDDTHPAGPPITAPAPAPVTRPATAPKNLSADEMLGQLLRTAPGSAPGRRAPLRVEQLPGADKTSGSGAVSPGAPGVTLIREGRYLPDRLGRLSRSPDGKTAEFTFDADGKTLRDPPLIIMPCAKLAQMQGTELGAGLDVQFRMSGTVTEYRGRNYVLPEKVVYVTVLSF